MTRPEMRRDRRRSVDPVPSGGIRAWTWGSAVTLVAACLAGWLMLGRGDDIVDKTLDMERTLLAFKTGDRSILLWNVLDNHLTRSYDQALTVLEDLLAMEGNEGMNEYFKWPDNW